MYKTTFITKLFAVFVLLCAGATASEAHAAQLLVGTTPAVPAAGEMFTIEVRLQTEEDTINAVEGSINLGSLRVERVHTGGSGLSLWPTEPRYSPGSHTVEFAGGVPGGILQGEEVLLFTIEVQAPAAGTYTVEASSLRAFKNDGTGSAVAVAPISSKVSVVAESSSLAASVPKDSTDPQFVSVEVGSDPSLFDGRSYLTFFATDDQSGVSRYQVKEGWFSRYKDADRYYVLADQSGGTDVWVRVTDAAGNTATKKISSTHGTSAWQLLLGGILILLAFTLVYQRCRKKRF